MAAPRRADAELKALVRSWMSGEGFGRHCTAIHHIPARAPVYGGIPAELDERAVQMLQRRGISSLYSHQSDAIEHALRGRHTVVVTPTASGKSLCYHLPVIHSLYRGESALYMFPTKALSQDQTAELNTLLTHAPDRDSGWEAQVYDGDTPPDVRRRVRNHGRLVVTNPDMLHAAILPHHGKWAGFFRSLRYVVLDELHTYRGVFGSHVANVLRRLRRICARYGVEPTFIATSATIANPGELAEALVGARFELVDQNGAPASERYVCFYNPPIADPQTMRRQGSLTAAQRIARTTLEAECGTIVFARSRQSVEVFINRLKDRLARNRDGRGLQRRVASYRGGYLPKLRRRIERGLRDGSIIGVVSTNALELGIDIGSLDVCVLAGYPGSVASTWQQFGRAGRQGSTALSVLVASDEPVDQFIIRNPDYFLERNPEAARIDPTNLRIVVEHLKCAVFELEWDATTAFGDLTVEETNEVLGFLEAETNLVQRVGDLWKWCSQTYPASEVNLRNIAEENFVVIDISADEPRVLAEVDFESAHTTIYPNAVYQVSGEPYRVERLDYDERRAYVRRSNDGYYTTAMHYASVYVLDEFGEREVPRARTGFGEVRVTDRFVGYKKIKFGTGENVGYGELNLPELDLHTTAYWLELSADQFPTIAQRGGPERWAQVVAGLGQVLGTAASLKLMCDPRDLEVTIGSVAHDTWLTSGFEGLALRDAHGELHTFEPDDTATGLVGSAVYDPTIFVYDRFPGGVGFGEGLFESHRELMVLAGTLVENCGCETGCPSCVGPTEEDRPGVRRDVAELLSALAAASSPARSDARAQAP